MSHFSLFSGANFCEEGRVISGRLANRFGSRFGRTQNYYVELLALYLCGVNDYLNAVFDDVVSLCGSCRNKFMPSHHLYRKSFNFVAILSLCVKSLSLQQRNMLLIFVDCPVK